MQAGSETQSARVAGSRRPPHYTANAITNLTRSQPYKLYKVTIVLCADAALSHPQLDSHLSCHPFHSLSRNGDSNMHTSVSAVQRQLTSPKLLMSDVLLVKRW